MNDSDFFEILGYFSNPHRQCKLDAEMPERARLSFESRYSGLVGIMPIPDNHNYYILHDGANKWGVELRIYFVGNLKNIPLIIQNMVVTPRPSTVYNRRINDNRLIWRLIEYGLLLGDTQNEGRIRNTVPSQFMSDFNRGYQIL